MQWTNAKIKKSPGISMDCLEMNQNACMSRALGIYIYIFFFFFHFGSQNHNEFEGVLANY